MKKLLFSLLTSLLIFSCSTKKQAESINAPNFNKELTIAFGSCNNQRKENTLYDDILKNKPKTWIWGGDIIYSDTDNPTVLVKNYTKLKNSNYKSFKDSIEVIATWDDHDYGINDGGIENPIKKEAQQAFLDFLDVSQDDVRRKQEGIYTSKIIKNGNNSVKIIVLDTRYFRTKLKKDPSGKKRYLPTNEGTMLGEKQWNWLEKELKNSKANFNLIISSIQFLSNKHGFESWGNMPLEVKKLEDLIVSSKANKVIILSGDRHIAEVSSKSIGTSYPLIDITSSGLTHAYKSFHGEENPYRIGKVIFEKNFGLIHFDFSNNSVLFEIRGEDNILLEAITQEY
jgi:alkaline phosphatase D